MTEVEGELPLDLSALFGENDGARYGPPFASALFGNERFGDEHGDEHIGDEYGDERFSGKLGDERFSDKLKCISYKTVFDDNRSLFDSIRKPTWKCGGESVLRKKREEYRASFIELCRMFAGEDFTEFCASCNYHPSQKEDDVIRAHDYNKLVMLKVAYGTVLSEASLSCTVFERMTKMVKDVITYCNTQLHDIRVKHGYITRTLPKRYNRRAVWHDLTVLARYKEEYEHDSLTPSEYAGLLALTEGNAVAELRRYCSFAFMNTTMLSIREPSTSSLYYHDGKTFRHEWNHFLSQVRYGMCTELHVVHKELFEYAITDGDGHISEHAAKVLLSEIDDAEVHLSRARQSYERQKADVEQEIESLASRYEVIDWVEVSLAHISCLHNDMGPCNRSMYLPTDLRNIQKEFTTALTSLRENEVEAVLATNRELEQDFKRLCA